MVFEPRLRRLSLRLGVFEPRLRKFRFRLSAFRAYGQYYLFGIKFVNN
jgi:hypothetical protein